MGSIRLALLVDCGFGGLEVSQVSADRMSAGLRAHAFEVERLSGEQATRGAIRAFLRGRAAELRAGDAFVFYFVGHGEQVHDPSEARGAALDTKPAVADLLLLVTHDVRATAAAAEDSRLGLAGIELGEWLRPIAEATDNVTIILDCCHATGMVPVDVAAGSVDRVDVRRALDRVSALVRDKYRHHRGDGEASEQIVRLVATTRSEYAVEGPGVDGGPRVGLFSDAVAESLARDGALALAWEDHIAAIQRSVLARCPTQRPGLEGPRDRLPFSTRRRGAGVSAHPVYEAAEAVVCVPASDERHTLHAGLAHGVEVGDEFSVWRVGETGKSIVARVTEVDVATATLVGGGLPMRRGGDLRRASPVRRATVTTVAVHGRRELAGSLRAALAGGAGVVFVDEGDASATLELGDTVSVLRVGDEVVHADAAITARGVRERLFAALRRVAHHQRLERGWQALEALGPGPAVGLEWGVAGRPEQLPRAGETLGERDAVWVYGQAVDRAELFVSAFHVRADRSVVHLTADHDHGRQIVRSRVTALTRTAVGDVAPWPLGWCAFVPRARPVHEQIVLLVSPVAVSLHGLAMAAPEPTRGPGRSRGLGLVRLEFRVAPDPAGPRT